MVLYHITKKKWLESILVHGLVPGYRKGIRVNGNKCKTVFLTNDIKKIALEQCGRTYLDKHELVILHIECTDIKLEPTEYRSGATYTISDFEFETNKIEPERIIKVDDLKIECI